MTTIAKSAIGHTFLTELTKQTPKTGSRLQAPMSSGRRRQFLFQRASFSPTTYAAKPLPKKNRRPRPPRFLNPMSIADQHEVVFGHLKPTFKLTPELRFREPPRPFLAQAALPRDIPTTPLPQSYENAVYSGCFCGFSPSWPSPSRLTSCILPHDLPRLGQ